MDVAINMNKQDRVWRLADNIMTILAGNDSAEAETAQALAVVATICLIEPSTAATRLRAAEGFTRQVREMVQRDDIVDWIKASIVHTQQAGRA